MNEKPWEADWTIDRELQGGGQGLVSVLVNKHDSSKLAVLKTIVPRWRNDSQAHERMRQEIDTLRRLSAVDARVPKVFNSYLEHSGSEPFVLMSYIKGSRLDEWIQVNGPATPGVAVALTRAVAETVSKCHELQIGHRDLKPANVILYEDNVETPHVIDFGISFDSKQTAILTKAGEIFRNEFITLPECQDLTGGHRDLRSDITALAGLFFMCLTGKAPIVLRDAQEAPPQRRHQDILRKSAISPEQGERLVWFFDRAFAYRISERFQKMEEFLGQLEQFSSTGKASYLDLGEEIRLFEGTLQKKDRNTQIGFLKKKYAPMKQQIARELSSHLTTLNQSERRFQEMGLTIHPTLAARPTIKGADLLDDENIPTVTFSRPHFNVAAVIMYAGFGVGMEIHLYTTSYASPANNVAQPYEQVSWSKVAVVEENETSLSVLTLSLVIDDLRSRLAREIRGLTKRVP